MVRFIKLLITIDIGDWLRSCCISCSLYFKKKGYVVKNFVSTSILSILVTGFSTAASAQEVVKAAANLPGIGSELIKLNEVTFQTGWIGDLGGTGVFWVLGGGLVAVSLVARRISA